MLLYCNTSILQLYTSNLYKNTYILEVQVVDALMTHTQSKPSVA